MAIERSRLAEASFLRTSQRLQYCPLSDRRSIVTGGRRGLCDWIRGGESSWSSAELAGGLCAPFTALGLKLQVRVKGSIDWLTVTTCSYDAQRKSTDPADQGGGMVQPVQALRGLEKSAGYTLCRSLFHSNGQTCVILVGFIRK